MADGDGMKRGVPESRNTVDPERAVEVLGASEARFATLLANLPGMVYQCRNDPDWTMRFVSHGSTDLTGYEPEELIDNAVVSYASLINPEDRDQVWREVQAALTGRRPFRTVYRITDKAGTERWVWEQGRGILSERGELRYLDGYIFDITEQKSAEAALRKTEDRYRSTLDNMLEGCQIIGFDWRYLYLNDAAVRHGRRMKEDLLGRTMMEIYPGMEETEIFDVLKRCMEKRAPRHIENEFTYPDGSSGCFELSVQPVPEGLFILSIDITARKQAEEALRRSNRALQTLSASNRTLVHAETEKGLLSDVCRIIVEKGGYRLAWVGYDEKEGAGASRPITSHGCGQGYADTPDMTWADLERGDGPTADAITTGKTSVYRNILAKPASDRLREDAVKGGYASSMALPLLDSATVFGALTVCSAAPDDFNDEEVRLLEELAMDLAFGIHSIRMKRRKEAAEEETQKLLTAVENSSDWILITDRDGVIRYANRAVQDLSGYGEDELIGQTPGIFKSGRHDENFYADLWDTILSGRTYQGILTNRRKDGGLFDIYHTITPLKGGDGRINFFVATSKDLTAQKLLEDKIHYLAYYDSLTGLPNRTLFNDRLSRSILTAEGGENLVAVLTLNLDRFRVINDTLGPAGGDAVLKEVAERLAAEMNEKGTVARISSNEFGIISPEASHTDDVIHFTQQVKDVISRPMQIGDTEIIVTGSMGIAIYPSDGATAAELMQYANVALSETRKQGGNSYQFYARGMNVRATEFVRLEKKLYDALAKGEFFLHYQPYFDTTTRAIAGMEALVRWQSPDFGLVSPGKFIPVLEESRLIVEVGQWILTTVCGQVAAWRDKGLGLVPVAVNFSTLQFRQKDFAALFSQASKAAGIEPRFITCEITESTFMENVEFTRAALKEIKDLGASVSVDDFGTGYSSLSYLKRLPVDNLKIDISFIRNIAEDLNDAAIVTAIISMAHDLGLKTIAEGVETEEQWKIMRLLRCDIIQGFYLSKPLPPDEAEKFLLPGKE